MKCYNRFLLTLSLLLFCCYILADETVSNSIPTKNEVGAAALPASILPVDETPFKMNRLLRPKFPDRQVIISTDDLSEDGKITPTINNKIADLSKKGGGTVVVPSGNWLSGRITLKSNINLLLEEGATIVFSDDIDDYQPAVFTRHEGIEVMGAGAFIYANGAKNIALSGNGVIMGPPMDSPMRSLPNGNSVVENDIPYSTPVVQRICDGYEGRTFYRPKAFSPINCKNVLVEGVTFERSLLWNVNPVYCENVIIRGITVNSVDVPSGDGIDISSCKNVLIEYSSLSCGDDCFTLKSGRCEDGLRVNKPTENILIRYCLAVGGHGGITCGSETAGGIKNVYLHDCVFDNTRNGFRFKTRRNRGGTTENILYENVRIINMREAFTWDLLGTPEYMGELARRFPPLDITPLTPTVKDITIRNFIVESTDRLLSINGIPEIPCANVLLENGNVKTNEIIRTLNDADGITLRNMTVQATNNHIKIDDSRNVIFDNITFYVPQNALDLDMKGEKTANIIIRNNNNDEDIICKGGINKLK
ncbi:MAG: glycoside hydrolase family 28 protein [Prevotella sp.]|nr:glycoside hydrolase family 28 protein [Prevotella sp.]